jgi:uncharacterized protein involved in copper resistance
LELNIIVLFEELDNRQATINDALIVSTDMDVGVFRNLIGGVNASEVGDDPLLAKVMIIQLETRLTDGSDPAAVLDAQAWLGKDLNKFWFKTDVIHLL